MEEAEARGRLTDLRERLYGSATRQMLSAAQLESGDRVLDIAAGTGDQSRLAARLVAPEGTVLATDISPEMLDVAARLAQQAGLNNITTQVMNAEQLDLPDNRFDAVISRFGLMLILRQHQALREIRRVLKPGGWVAGLVWATPERNPLFTLDIEIIRRYGEAGEQPDAFSLADGATFARTLTEAGFREVQVDTIPLTFWFPSFEALTAWWGPLFDRALARLEQEPRERLQEEVRQVVRQFERPEGIVAPAEVLLGVGMK